MATVCLTGKLIQRETFVSSVVGKYSSAIRLVENAKRFAKVSTGWLLYVIPIKEILEKEMNGGGQTLPKMLIWQKFLWGLCSSTIE